MNNRGKINITFLIGILLLIGVVVGVLEINGVINIRALFGGEGTFIPVDYEKEVVKLCNSMDSEGMYNLEAASKITEDISEFYKEYEEKGDDNWEALLERGWKVFKGAKYCNESICYIYEYGEGRYRFTYDCKNQKASKLSFDAVMNEERAKSLLATACTFIDRKGNYENADYGISCKNSYCNVSINGKLYKKDCRVKVETKEEEKKETDKE